MNLYLQKLPKKEEINSDYLINLYTNNSGKRGLSYKNPLAKNNMNFNQKNIYLPQALERKFQFGYVLKTYNSLINNKKKNTNSVEKKGNSDRLYLPVLKEFEISKRNNNSKNYDSNVTKKEEYKYNIIFKKNNHLHKLNSLKNIPLYDFENNNDEVIDTFSKLKNILDKSNSTISQSIINNATNSASKMFNENEKEKEKREKIIFRNLSHGSIFEAYKKQFLDSIKDYKSRNKMAKTILKEKLEKIKNEKIPKSKNEELFNEYELNFNQERYTKKLNNEFQFFQYDINNAKKKSVDEAEIRKKKLFIIIKKNEDKKNNCNYVEMNKSGIKPSQRIIQNMLRKEKKLELNEQSLISLKEK